jgi:hypothetical protein
MSSSSELQSLANVDAVGSRYGKAGGVDNFNCVTTPPKGARDAFPRDVSFTVDFFVVW